MKTRAIGKERQAHGFSFERFIIDRFNYKDTAGYTSKWDAFTHDNIPVSIKTTNINKSHDIMLGDIFRQYDIKEDRFILVIGFWEDNEYDIKEFLAIGITTKYWRMLFNYEAMCSAVKLMKVAGGGIYGNEEDKMLWDKLSSELSSTWKAKTPNIIRPRPRWSKPNKSSQNSSHRIQCCIRYNDLEKHFLKRTDLFKHFKSNVEDEFKNFMIENGGENLINKKIEKVDDYDIVINEQKQVEVEPVKELVKTTIFDLLNNNKNGDDKND